MDVAAEDEDDEEEEEEADEEDAEPLAEVPREAEFGSSKGSVWMWNVNVF